jgi:hypothetical protein
MKRTLALVLSCSLAALTLVGCGKSRPKADPEVARDTLRAALGAWKKGESADVLKERSPPIHVADHEWQGGFALLDYQVSAKDQLFGSDLRCQVELSLRNPRGKALKKKATYSVGTNHALTVVREDDE